MFRQTVGGADHGVAVLRRAVLVLRGFEFFHHGIVRLLRVQRIVAGTFNGFVEFWERAIGERAERGKNPADSLGVHDEGSHVILRIRIGLEIGNIVAGPFLGGFAPPDLAARSIPGLAVEVAGRAVVKHAAVCRPGPRPILMNAETGRVASVAAHG